MMTISARKRNDTFTGIGWSTSLYYNEREREREREQSRVTSINGKEIKIV